MEQLSHFAITLHRERENLNGAFMKELFDPEHLASICQAFDESEAWLCKHRKDADRTEVSRHIMHLAICGIRSKEVMRISTIRKFSQDAHLTIPAYIQAIPIHS